MNLGLELTNHIYISSIFQITPETWRRLFDLNWIYNLLNSGSYFVQFCLGNLGNVETLVNYFT